MSSIFGEMRQIAFVVPDIDAAMKYWVETLGVGPFFIKRAIEFNNYRYRGESVPSPMVSIALANSGNVPIELIQQHDIRPSIYKEFLDSGRHGLQHVSSWLTRADFDRKKIELQARGLRIAQEGVIPASGVRLVYFDTAGADGLVFEIADLAEPAQLERVTKIAREARHWDGIAPVREVKA